MRIKLNEIPEDGREYTFNRQTGELNEDLRDLIGDLPFEAKIFIKPMNTKNYDVRGFIKTATQEMCSLCGDTFKFKVEAKIQEILIPGADEIKNSQFAKSNHVSELDESGPGVSEYKNDIFEVGEFLHEAIAINVPFNPKPDLNDDGSCTICLKTLSQEAFYYDEKMSEVVKTNPFQALKSIKVN